MSKSRLFSGKIKKLSGNKLTADRYDYLDSSQAEPDLGLPNLVGSVLIGSTNSNVRTWSDLLTIEGPTIRIRSTLTTVGFYTPNALVVDGGIGVAGDINILGKALINNVEVLTTQSGLTSQFGQSIIDLVLRLTTSTNATSTSTGGLIVSGGVGINKDVWIGGTTFAGNVYSNGSLVGSSTGTTSTFLINNFTQATSTNSGALVVKGGVGIGGNLYVTGDIVDITGRIIGSGTTGTTSTFVISNTSSSTSTNSGALVVTGGAGIGGALFVNTTSYIAGSQIITTATVNIYATKTTIIAGTDTAVNTSTGEVTIWNTSTLESVTSRGNSTTNLISITNTTPSLGVTSGALVVGGGVGIGGALFVSTTSFIADSQIITTATIGDYATKTTIIAGTDTAVNTSTGEVTIWNTSTLESVTSRGDHTSYPITITNANLADTTTSGALVVSGGVGIGQDLYVGGNGNFGGDIYTRGQQVLTTSTVNQYANQTAIFAGTDTAVSTSTGAVTIWNISTFQSVTNRGNSTTNTLSILNGTESISSQTGALFVDGGVGINKNLYVGGNINLSTGSILSIGGQSITQTFIRAGTDTAVSSSTGTVTIWNTSTLQTITDRGQSTNNAIAITNTGTSTGAGTGALVVSGGVGIGQNLYVGNKLAVLSTLSSTSSIYQNAAYVEGGLGVGKSLYVTGEAIFQNNVTFLGTTTYVLTTNTVYTDNLIELHYPSTPDNLWTVDDGLDIGFRFHYYDGGSDRNAGLVLSNDNKYLEWHSRGNEDTTSSFVGTTYGTFKTGNIILTNTTTSTSTDTGALTVNGGVGVAGNLNVGGDIVGGGVRSTSSSTAPAVATIGDIWYNITNDRMYRYTTVNNSYKFWLDFTGQKVKYIKNIVGSTSPTTIEYLVVGGGGGGGHGGMYAGGGGGGGFLTNLGSFGYAVSTGTTYTIQVGAGGLVGASSGSRGSNGDYSQFDTIIASGGGGGGTVGNGDGISGGSGGGGASISGGSNGGGATSGQGNIGGTVGNASAPYLGGGGGGAGGQGSNGGGTSNAGNGNGGAGLALNISGSTTYYAGGGGGGLYYYPANSGTQGGQGGQGGGGRGESSDVSGTAGVAYTGGGGGAGYNGGAGIVIIRYPNAYLGPVSVIGATATVNNGYRIYTWNTSGTITF